ncbi:hypothetical protein LCGC14_0456600 [marine sediment metagenome]|uniref:Uncharacterized protein n=1 Tax=marine sediment metagenome TaxID=412755 RepID=A0A0F9VQ43_9ZZZZ
MTASAAMKGAPSIIHNNKDAAQKELQKFIEEECKPVKGIFKNYECPGGAAKITQHKYRGQPLFAKTMEDGQEYEVPLWVARWLNGIDVTAKACNGRIGSCSYARHQYSVDRNTGQPIQIEGQRRQRYGFQSLDFSV